MHEHYTVRRVTDCRLRCRLVGLGAPRVCLSKEVESLSRLFPFLLSRPARPDPCVFVVWDQRASYGVTHRGRNKITPYEMNS